MAMEIDKAKFERVVKEAKSKTNDRRWLNAIDAAQYLTVNTDDLTIAALRRAPITLLNACARRLRLQGRRV
jgi:hypothetical protein